jgi:hypothetical protein
MNLHPELRSEQTRHTHDLHDYLHSVHHPQQENNATAPHMDVWLDKQDILQRMHISERTLQKWRTKKILPYSKIGGKIYYREMDLIALLEKNMR